MTLSPEDLAHARENLRWTRFFDHHVTEGSKLNVTRLELAVEDFTSTTVGGVPDKVAWSARVLWNLSDGSFNGAETGRFTSMDELRRAFEAAAAEAQEEFEWQLGVDPAFANYMEKMGKAKGHHWGDDTLDSCRCWLNESDYQVWFLHFMVGEDAAEAMRDALLDMATTYTNGENVAEATAKSFEKHTNALAERYAESRGGSE